MLISTRKSQTEIIGLVVIVILIALGMLFMLKFSSKQIPETQKTYTHAQLASRTLSALMETSTTCDRAVSDLLKGCLENQPDCDGETACNFAKQQIDEILTKTLKTWQKDYIFTINSESSEIYSTTNNPEKCTADIDSDFYYVQVSGSMMTLKLSIC